MSGGVDVKVFAEAAERGDGFPSLIEPVSRLESLPIPTLALCHGVCLTAAFEIALACDLIWAGESARFGLVEKVVGLTPGAGGTQRLAARAGVGRASELVMSGETYDAATLREWGVVNRVVPDAELEREGMAFARELAAGPTLAHAATKRILRAFREGGVGAADEITPGEFSGLFASEDLRGAVRSFLEDGPGKATFRGR
jgi:enoyl-CoA hydratase/carnithine racemase